MKWVTRLLVFACLLLIPNSCIAISAPQLSSPENNATVSLTSLKWQTVSDSIQYRIIVDDQPTIAAPFIKDYRTDNTTYTPQLNPGTYYWKVTAKDSVGSWGSWSEIRSFIYLKQNSSPSPTPISTEIPISAKPLETKSIFQVESLPSEVNSDQTFTASVTITGLESNKNYFLKGAFIKDGSTNYFGKTKVRGVWIKNNQSFSNQMEINTDSSGSWKDKIEIMPDTEDSGFKGSDNYIFKVGRYSSGGSGPIWSNSSTIKIFAVETSDIQSGNNHTVSPPTLLTKSQSEASTSTTLEKPSLPKSIIASGSAVAGTATSNPISPDIPIKSGTNYFLLLGLVITLTGASLIVYNFRKDLFGLIKQAKI